jgi:transposase InsO family protein
MSKKLERDRQAAIQRFLDGESPVSIWTTLGYSKPWFYRWLDRWREEGADWVCERSRRPHTFPQRTAIEVEEIVKLVRLELYNQGVFCGAQAIRWKMEDLSVNPLPSLRTINRILVRHELTHRRTGRYEPKGKAYPQLPVAGPSSVHQTDFVGPCYLHGPVRFYNLNSVDLATGRCAVEAVWSRSKQDMIDAFWASWQRLGCPLYQQVDNEMVFYGSPTHPRGMGHLIRLCLLNQIEPCFIPVQEPWRNGVVEKFNHHWLQGVLHRAQMESAVDLRRENQSFELRHNSRYRYSKLNGQTPLECLKASQAQLRFPLQNQAPRAPLPKPESGKYHLIRFIRSAGQLNVFGEHFKVPSEAIYEYVRATIDVAEQTLSLYLENKPIEKYKYRLR